MQKTARSAGRGPEYRERLGPSLWILVSAALAGPMAALVFVPLDTSVALITGILVSLAAIAVMIAAAPVVEVRDGWLRAGRARIEVAYLGEPSTMSGDDARHARGAGLDPRAWHVIRGGIDGIVIVPVVDDDDPTPSWVISSRTPERLAAAVRRAYAAHSVQISPSAPS